MTKPELKMLARAFEMEIHGGLLQTKSKLAAKLVSDGYLCEREERIAVPPLGTMTVKGYALTLLGNLTYCTSC